MEVEPEDAELRRDIAEEVLEGDGDADDAGIGEACDVCAGDAQPPTRGEVLHCS